MQSYLDLMEPDGSVVAYGIEREGLLLVEHSGSVLVQLPDFDSHSGAGVPQARVIWDRHGTKCLLEALSDGVAIDGTRLSARARVPLDNNTEFSLGPHPVRFRRKPDAPRFGGETVHEVDLLKLRGAALVIGRFEPSPPQEGAGNMEAAGELRWELDAADRRLSHRHVIIRWNAAEKSFVVEDVSSSGALLNAESFKPVSLIFGDRLSVGDYHFDFTGRSLRWVDAWSGGGLKARNVVVEVPTAEGVRQILRGVSMNIRAGEFNFIGVLGGSGQGKSTMMNALCGINPATSGEVEIGGVPLNNRAQIRKLSIGYVPQDDLVHRELTVEEAITFSARLRFRLNSRELRALVEGIMTRMVLLDHRAKRISMLSGGQRKRVSIATEILAKPAILFLDEPSSGLDPEIERRLMVDLQSLAKGGITVIATTHVLLRAYLFSRICFIHDGRLVFWGTVNEAGGFFFPPTVQSSAGAGAGKRVRLEEVYRKLYENEDGDAATVEAAFNRSGLAQSQAPSFPPPPPVTDEKLSARTGVGFARSIAVLMRRQWRIIRSDRLNVLFLFAQSLIIGGLVGWVSPDVGFRMFIALIATMWFGCSNAAQQIVSELPVFRRERVSGLGLNSYILSKFTFLFTITALQSMLLLTSLTAVSALAHPVDLPAAEFVEALRKRENPAGDDSGAATPEHEQANYRVNDSPQTVFDVSPNGKNINETEIIVYVGRDGEGLSTLSKSEYLVTGTGASAKIELLRPVPPGGHVVISAPLLQFSLRERALWMLACHLSMEMNLFDSGGRVLRDPITENPVPGVSRGLPVERIVWVCLGWRLGGMLLGALVGVTLGLMISALAQSATQAVLWVPLILIPQILLGGFVVTVPEMSASVRAFCGWMPSFASERLIEVSLIYGQRVPKLSNQTKIPNFLSNERGARGEEKVIWTNRAGNSAEQKFDKSSPHNTAWQNLAVRHAAAGQHRQVTEAGQNFPRSIVNQRNDVRYSWQSLFVDDRPAAGAVLVLLGWTVGGYLVIAVALQRRQYGK